MQALTADESYYLDDANERQAAECWRKMAAIHGDRNRPEAETAYVTAAFIDDAVNAGVDASWLDRAGAAWRLSGERFMPTFGQLFACAKEAKVTSGHVHLRQLRNLIDPPEIVANLECVTPEPKPEPQGMDLEQTLAAIKKMEAERDTNCISRVGKPDREWGVFDEKALNALYARRDSFQAEAVA